MRDDVVAMTTFRLLGTEKKRLGQVALADTPPPRLTGWSDCGRWVGWVRR